MKSESSFYFCFRNPNYPLQVEQLLNTDKEAKRFKMIKWEPFDSRKRYLELGETRKDPSVKFDSPFLADLKPRLKHNYRGHSVSVWLSLVPQLESAGSYPGGGGGHGVLTGPTWGLVRNTTNFPGVQQISLSDKVLSPLSQY